MPNIDHTGLGSTLTFEDEVVRMRNLSTSGSYAALVKGDILETHLESAILPSHPGYETGAAATTWSVVSTTDGSADLYPARMIGVALEDAAYGEYLRVGFKGVFECACDANADEGVLLRISGSANGILRGAATSPHDDPVSYAKMVGIALENTTTTGDLTKVLFDGLNGFTASHP